MAAKRRRITLAPLRITYSLPLPIDADPFQAALMLALVDASPGKVLRSSTCVYVWIHLAGNVMSALVVSSMAATVNVLFRVYSMLSSSPEPKSELEPEPELELDEPESEPESELDLSAFSSKAPWAPSTARTTMTMNSTAPPAVASPTCHVGRFSGFQLIEAMLPAVSCAVSRAVLRFG